MAGLKASLGQCPFSSLCRSVRIGKLFSFHSFSPNVTLQAEDDHSSLKLATEINTTYSLVVITALYSFYLTFTLFHMFKECDKSSFLSVTLSKLIHVPFVGKRTNNSII